MLTAREEVRNRGPALDAVAIAGVTLAVIFVVLRWGCRISRRALGWDDYMVTIAAVFAIAQTAMVVGAVHHGFGRPRVQLTRPKAKKALQLFWVYQILYKFVTWFTKASILLLYRRIFDTRGSRAWGLDFHRTVIVLLVLVAACWFLSTVISIFACVPLARSWDKTIKGGCVATKPWWFAYAALNISSDVIIWLLPMPLIRRLQAPWRQRIMLMLIFSVGAFVIVTSILRMTTIDTGSKTLDPTYGPSVTLAWTIVESNLGIICASLSTLKILFTRLFPGGDTKSGQSGSRNTYTARTSVTARDEGWNELTGAVSHPTSRAEQSTSDLGENHDGISKVTDIRVSYDRPGEMPAKARQVEGIPV